MTYRNKKHTARPEKGPRTLIEHYISLQQQMDEKAEALHHPADSSAREYENTAREFRDLANRNHNLERDIVLQFRTPLKLYYFCTRYYPELDIRELIKRFSGGFDFSKYRKDQLEEN